MPATKEKIIAPRSALERYIRSTHPVLYVSGRRDFQGANTFLSEDAYGRICTVTGAVWTRQGYNFDGTDDKIDITSVPSLNIGTGSATWLAWVNNTDTRGWKGVIEKGSNGIAVNSSYVAIQLYDGVNNPFFNSTLNTYADGVWRFIAGVRDTIQDKLFLYINGVIDGAGTTDTAGDCDNTSALGIGHDGGGAGYITAKIGESLMFKRALNAVEIMNIYQATRWKY